MLDWFECMEVWLMFELVVDWKMEECRRKRCLFIKIVFDLMNTDMSVLQHPELQSGASPIHDIYVTQTNPQRGRFIPEYG